MALVSADSRIAELLTELHQLIKQTQVKSHSPPLLEGLMGCDTELWRGQGRLCSNRLDTPEPQWCHVITSFTYEASKVQDKNYIWNVYASWPVHICRASVSLATKGKTYKHTSSSQQITSDLPWPVCASGTLSRMTRHASYTAVDGSNCMVFTTLQWRTQIFKDRATIFPGDLRTLT